MRGSRLSAGGPQGDADAGAPDPGGVIEVQRVETLDAYLELEPEWADLVERSDTDRVFYTHRWFRCWWEAFGQGARLFVLCARRGGRLVGIAPLYRSRTRFRGMPAEELRFLANGYSEECDFIVDALELGVREALLKHLASARGTWHLLQLNGMRTTSPLWHERLRLLEQAKLRYEERPGLRVPYLSIDGSWADYLAQKSKKFRKTYRNRMNVMAREDAPVHVEKRTTSAEVTEALESIFTISGKSWKATEGRAITDSREAMTLFERLSDVVAEQGRVTLWLAIIDGTPVAFEYHLTHAGVTAPIRADFDEAYRDISPGAYLEAEIYRHLFDDPDWGITEYNSCADSYAYTRRWTDTAREHAALRIAAPGVYGGLLHLLGGLRRPRRGGHEADSTET